MKKYIFIFLLAFIFFAVKSLPINVISPLVVEKLDGKLKINNLNGTIWKGEARNIEFEKLKFESIAWDFSINELLQGRLAFALDIKIDSSNELRFLISVGAFKQIRAENLKGVINVGYLKQITKIPNYLVDANFVIDNSHIYWDDLLLQELPSYLDTNIVVEKLNLIGKEMGDYQLAVKYQDDKLQGDINNKKNAIIDTKLNVSLNDDVINIKGKIKGINEDAKSLFENLNISENVNLKIKLSNLK
jgi:hypothetical protein